MKVRKLAKKTNNSTDIHLLVSANESIEEFDYKKIKEAIIKEAELDDKTSEDVAKKVEKYLLSLESSEIPVSLIRDCINVELAKMGLVRKLKNQKVVGIPKFDLETYLFEKSSENSNISSNNPEAVNLFISETITKKYALENVFSKDVSDRHKSGAIHIHDLGLIYRPYCGSHSLGALALHGLDGWLESLPSTSSPAHRASTLTGHLNTFIASIQSFYSGAIGIGFLNIFYAPYVEGLTYEEMKQQAQYLIFSASQNCFSRGGQAVFSDFGIHSGIPKFLSDKKAIVPGGKISNKTYKDYEKTAQKFAHALLDVWKEGDYNNKPFFFPKLNYHITNESFTDKEQNKLLKKACDIASINGSTYFIYDRDEGNGESIKTSQCCRLSLEITDKFMIDNPHYMRFVGVQNVTINLPHASMKAKGDYNKTIEYIKSYMDLAMKAHLQKKRFLESLMKPGLPLWQLRKPYNDNRPYMDLEGATYIIGILGLNECVKNITGKELHESIEAYKIGMKIITTMYMKAKLLSKEHALKVSLEESPAESASGRLAKIDMKTFKEAIDLVKGNKETGDVFYTNSVHYTAEANINIWDRIVGQSKFHPMIESGAITHVFIGEEQPSPETIENLVKKVWDNTQTKQITISPTFCMCNECKKIWRDKVF